MGTYLTQSDTTAPGGWLHAEDLPIYAYAVAFHTPLRGHFACHTGFMVQLGCPHSKDPKAPELGEGAPAAGSVFNVLPRNASSLTDEGTPTTRGTDGDQAGCIQDEFDGERILNTIGTLAMANNDTPHTGGSQFFINTDDNPQWNFWTKVESDSQHPVFGRVVGGPTGESMSVVKRIENSQLDFKERPMKPITIKSVVLL
eukprot:m.713129 g.713129  ORF g.713129 m.713129 type:complete len:200 (-) comp22970_c0_seq5:494-1093(-)